MRCLALLGLLVVLSGTASAAEYFVDQASPAAADTNPGTAEKPFRTITKALAGVKPGDTVTVKAGVYREEVEIPASGTPEARITLRAAPGARVVVSGADPIGGWRKVTKEEARGNPNWENIYMAEVTWRPTALFQDDRMLKVSRFPAVPKAKYMSDGGDKTRVVDLVHLTQPAGFWEGGLLVVRDARTTNYDQGIITKYDPEKHELTADKDRRAAVVGGKDEYFVKNLVSIISDPGDWALDATKTPARVYIWPVGNADPNALRIEGTCRGHNRLVRWKEGAGFITIDGLEVAGSAGSGLGAGGEANSVGHAIEVRNCVVRHSGRHGIDLSRQQRVTVRHCIVARNADNGICLGYSKDCAVEENLVHGNAVDGIVLGWYSSGNKVLRNCVHDQWSQSHPDGIQTFRDVSDLVIQDNVFLNIGQGFQCENTYRTKIVNNMFVGTRGGCLQLSPRSADYRGQKFGPCAEFEIANNTLAFNAQHNVTLLKTFRAWNNVMGGGYRDPNGGYTSDYNFYLPGLGASSVKDSFGQETHSKMERPKYRNAPAAVYQTDEKNFKNCTSRKLHLKGSAGGFEVGDLIEVNWDGRQRKVTEVGAGYIVFEPALAFVHPFGWDQVANWKKNADFAIDLRQTDDSPGRKAGKDGRDIGSNLDIQAYMRGDFNGDGKRYLPAAVKALEYEVHPADE